MRFLLQIAVFLWVTFFAAAAFADRNMNPLPAINGSNREVNVSKTTTLNADIIVVGGGLSGMSAALTAVQGKAGVIVFEKLPSLGGAGVYPEGSLGIGTNIQKREGKGNRTVLDALDKIMEFAHYRVNTVAIKNILDNSGETINWLEKEGVPFKGLRTVYTPEKSLWTWHIYQKNGASVTKNFYKKILAGGGRIFLETPVKKLITNDKSEVIGVEAVNSVTGEKFIAYGKGVIIATGGFANNKDMIEKYVTDVSQPNMVPVQLRGPLIDGREGDGIKMAMEIGAATAGMQTIAGNSPYVDQWPPIRQFNGADYQKQARTSLSQPFLWVNRRGERFFNESNGSSFTDVYNAMTMNGGIMYSIWDDKMRKKMVSEGPVTPFNAIVVPGMPMKALDEAISIGLKEGWLFKANTLEDLAKQLGMEPNTLKNTVKKINEYAKTGVDKDFGRRKEHLFAFSDKGPYYAVKGIRAYFLTLGGLKMNEHLQVYDKFDRIIPNLYVTGQDMGGLYDSSYDLLLEGSASGFALTTGRMAAKHILETRVK
jgi:fumarate reductase flavoprotein subunit